MDFRSWIVALACIMAAAFPSAGEWAADLLITAPHYHLTGAPADISAFNPYVPKDAQSHGSDGYDIRDGWYDITPPSAADSGYAIYKHEDSCQSLLSYDGELYELGQWFGGYGATSFVLSDVDGNGARELYYTYSFGSGLHRSHAAYFDPASREMRAFDFTHMNGDMVLSAEGPDKLKLYTAKVVDSSSFVDILLVAEDEVGTIRYEDGEIRLVPAE